MTTSDEMVLNNIGNTESSYLRIKSPIALIRMFNKGDKCYVYEPLPDTFDELCNDADYIIESVERGHQYGTIMLKGLV